KRGTPCCQRPSPVRDGVAPDAARSGFTAAAAPSAGARTGRRLVTGRTPPGAPPGSAPGSRPRARPAPAAGLSRAPARPRAARPRHASVGPPPATTGLVPLPPGGPVAVPAAPQTAAPGPSGTAIAVLLIGPAGAGKTSVAKYWADHRRMPTAHISLDDVREWVRSGFADPQTRSGE